MHCALADGVLAVTLTISASASSGTASQRRDANRTCIPLSSRRQSGSSPSDSSRAAPYQRGGRATSFTRSAAAVDAPAARSASPLHWLDTARDLDPERDERIGRSLGASLVGIGGRLTWPRPQQPAIV